jgi:hypothetical protein
MAVNPNDTGDLKDTSFDIADVAGTPQQIVTPTKFTGPELAQASKDLDQQQQLWDDNRRDWRNFERTNQF